MFNAAAHRNAAFEQRRIDGWRFVRNAPLHESSPATDELL